MPALCIRDKHIIWSRFRHGNIRQLKLSHSRKHRGAHVTFLAHRMSLTGFVFVHRDSVFRKFAGWRIEPNKPERFTANIDVFVPDTFSDSHEIILFHLGSYFRGQTLVPSEPQTALQLPRTIKSTSSDPG